MIPKPVMPTKEQMIEVATRWWDVHHKDISLLAYTEYLNDVSIPYNMVLMSPEYVEKLLDDVKDFEYLNKQMTELVKKAITEIGTPFFLKTITRSPKDYTEYGLKGDAKMNTAEDCVYAISASMRTFDDLCLLRYIDKCYLVFKPFIEIPKRNEWRVLINDGNIVGISQYFYMIQFNYSAEELVSIEYKIRQFISSIIPEIKTKSFVADVFFNTQGLPTLIELNPFGNSDPCLFISYDKLDGTLKTLSE